MPRSRLRREPGPPIANANGPDINVGLYDHADQRWHYFLVSFAEARDFAAQLARAADEVEAWRKRIYDE